MTLKNGQLQTRVVSQRDLIDGGEFELYVYDFLREGYGTRPEAVFKIKKMNNVDHDEYLFSLKIPLNRKVKCVIKLGNEILATAEKYIGNTHRIIVSCEQTKIGMVYKLRTEDTAISRNLLFYEVPGSANRMKIPEDLLPGEEKMFKLYSGASVNLKFGCTPSAANAFSIIYE